MTKIKVLIITIIVTHYCWGFANTDAQENMASNRPGDSRNFAEIEHNGLPPEPETEAQENLLGVDMDNDGVRDDIQRYIDLTYPDEVKVRLALEAVAKQYQLLLALAQDPDASFENATKMARHGECLDFLKGEKAADILAALQAEILNNKVRNLAYLNYTENLSGKIILGRPLAEWSKSCLFDVTAVNK